jgi:fructuronate reductase
MRFDRARPAPGIAHLGCGAFHRAHQAWFTQRALDAEFGEWGIVAVNLRGPSVPDALNAQDHLYTLITRGTSGETDEIVGAIVEALYAPAEPARVVARLADPAIRIVTLTVTEKGYCHVPATGDLDTRHPDIVADLATPETPRSAIGFLVAGLAARRARGHAPPAVVSCDNLPGNGRVLAKLVSQFAELRDPKLAAWIAANVAFPATMVDRIVPATTAADRAGLLTRAGYTDRACVVAEPFAQWAIEDWDGPRPAWARVGVRIVPDVAPYERAKLRLLNGAHSLLAYRGLLAGHATVAEAMADPALARAARALMAEAAAALAPVPGLDLAAYAEKLCGRFENPGMRHRLAQIAMDGSQKLPQRLLGTIAESLEAGRPCPEAMAAVAAWIEFARRQGAKLDDPLAARLAQARDLDGFLAVEAVFGRDLPRDPRFRDGIARELARFVLE